MISSRVFTILAAIALLFAASEVSNVVFRFNCESMILPVTARQTTFQMMEFIHSW